jgi:O-methyltransferase/methyltransferase family protein
MAPRNAPGEPTTIRNVQRGVFPAFALLAGMQLELFTALAEGPASAAQAAQRLGVREQKLAPLLYALVLTGLVELKEEKFANSAEADEFLVKGRRRYLGGVHELWNDLWHATLNTAQSIRTGKPQAKHDFVDGDTEALTSFLRGLAANALPRGRRLAKEFDFSGCRSVIDVGGGSGSGLLGLLEAYPKLRGTLFELPPIAAIAETLLRGAAHADRIAIEASDITAAPPESRHDAAICMQLIQVLSPADAARAIAHMAQAVEPGGTVYIVASGALDDSRLAPATAVFINVTFLNVYDDGQSYTQEQYFGWLAAAGCVEPQRRVLEDETSILWARKA